MRRLLIVPVLLTAVVLAACGSSGPSTSATTTSSTKAPSAVSPGSATGTGSSAPSGTKAPAVADPTNLKTEPVVSAGTPPPPSKLVTKDLVIGTGAAVTASSTVLVKYLGADYTTGKDFTSATWTSGQATSFALSGVVPGFAQGLVGMKVGGRREIVIPPSLGYGSTGEGSTIKPNETLVFVVDLESVS